MQAETPTHDQLKAHLAIVGLAVDDARLDALLPLYAGVLNGSRRLASLDLGETEPTMTYKAKS